MKSNQDNTDTTKLYEAIRNGNEVAFSRYYESTTPWLVPFIRRITKDVEEAWNIAQDTFAKLWLQHEQINPAKSLDGFVSKMATNAALNLIKRKQYHYEYSGEQMFVQNAEDHAADSPILVSEMEARIERVIQSMPPQRRMVFELSREHNLTYDEIAERMNLSYSTVRNHMVLALSTLRSLISILVALLFLPQR